MGGVYGHVLFSPHSIFRINCRHVQTARPGTSLAPHTGLASRLCCPWRAGARARDSFPGNEPEVRMIRQLLRPLLLAGDEQDKRSCLHFSKMQEMFSVPTRAPDMKVHLAPPMAVTGARCCQRIQNYGFLNVKSIDFSKTTLLH